jgi:CRISPR/Cas system-associated exonuclease Cas4 (RecB family)
MIHKEETYSVDLNNNEFNSIESALINKLIEKSNIDSHLTVDELNSLLGIKKKTIEIQKRVRTEAINRINHKFNVNFNLETIFIERTRSIDDRRYFNYIINKENAKVYLKQI